VFVLKKALFVLDFYAFVNISLENDNYYLFWKDELEKEYRETVIDFGEYYFLDGITCSMVDDFLESANYR